MQSKQYLQKIRTIDMMINCKREQITELRALLSGGAISYEERVQTSPNADRMANLVAKIIELKDDINFDIDELLSYKKNARELIEKLDDDMEKIILYKRYFDGKSFEQISVECGYSWRWTISLHGNALKNFEKILNNSY